MTRLLISTLTLAGLLLAGCDDNGESESIIDIVLPTPFAENIPEGCPSNNNGLTVSSDEVANFPVKHAWYSTWNGLNGSLIFTSFDDFDPTSIYGHSVVGEEALVVIKLKRADGSAVGVGRYESTRQKDPKPENQATEFNISTVGLASGVFDSSGVVEFTHFGADFTCGTIKASDSSSRIEGAFIAHYKKVD
jgi:hypothetical protein